MAFRLRSEKTTDGIRSLAELSKQTTGVMYAFLVLIVISGVFLGFQGGWWRGWICTALALLMLTIGAMSALGGSYKFGDRSASRRGTGAGGPRHQRPGRPEEICRAVGAAPVGFMTAIGVVALALLLWLMILKPF